MEGNKEEVIKLKELAVLKLGATLAKHGMGNGTYKIVYNNNYSWHYTTFTVY